MKHLKWIALGYFMALTMNGCDPILGHSDGTTAELEYGDYGTVSWKPLYVKIVD